MLSAAPHGNLSRYEVALIETAQFPPCARYVCAELGYQDMCTLLYKGQTPCVLRVRMSFQRSDMHTCSRVDNVQHHTVPGFSFFFDCMLQ